MCAKLPDNVSTVSIPVAIPDLAPVVTAVRTPAPAPVAAPPEPAPAHPPLTVETYRLKKMFPMENDKYIVSVLRENKAEASAIDVTMTLSARVKRETVEYVESGPGQTLEAGATSYFGLRVSTVVFDEILDAPPRPEPRSSGPSRTASRTTLRTNGAASDCRPCPGAVNLRESPGSTSASRTSAPPQPDSVLWGSTPREGE